jgi:hypothetical protein
LGIEIKPSITSDKPVPDRLRSSGIRVLISNEDNTQIYLCGVESKLRE